MKNGTLIALLSAAFVIFVLAAALPDWHAPLSAVQVGPNGQSMIQFGSVSPWDVAPPPAAAEPAAAPGGPLATASFHNLKVMSDVSAAEFSREHRAMTAWVAPKQGCGFCHTGNDYASDANPMKLVARNMISMTRYLNTTWRSHVGASGVTCFTCHRGEPVPPETWYPVVANAPSPMFEQGEHWDDLADTVRKFFPDNGWALYLLAGEPIRVESRTALRGNTVASQIETKRVYEMMMQMSDGIGVNCGYCHSSRSFSDWSQSTPSRWVAHDALKMTRDIDVHFLLGLQLVMPQTRQLSVQNMLVATPQSRSPQPGNGLAVCATCHYGHPDPDGGAATIRNYAALASTTNAAPPAPSSGPKP